MSTRTSCWAAMASLLLAAASAVGARGAEPADPASLNTDPHLAGWWKLDESAGVTAADASGHGRAGQLLGGLAFDQHSVPGRLGKALQLDGQDDAIQITGYKGVLGTAPRTISVWLKTDRPRGEIVSWGHKDFGNMWIFSFIRSRPGLTPHGGYYYMEPGVHDNQWHHVVGVLSGGDEPRLDHNAKLYLDGKEAPLDRIGLLALWPIDTKAGQDVTFGKGFKGALDDLRIYDRVLTEEEVQALFRMKD